ncbi:MAG: pyridoxal-phosphate dependent enzyme [Pseudomonadota bacterium]
MPDDPAADAGHDTGAAIPDGPSRLSLARIEAAAAAIDPVFANTPQYACDPLGAALGCEAVLKVETLNPIRCFKGRGATWLMAEAARRGDGRAMVTASVGNFGQAMAYAARAHGRPITIFAARSASPLKLQRMRDLGATVRLHGADFDAAKAAAKAEARATGARLVEDGSDVETAEGAGSIGLELARLEPALDAVVIPLGNGAMTTGVATALAALAPGIEVIAVQAEGAPAMARSWQAGRVIETAAVETIADGIAIRVPIPAALGDMQGVVADVLLVDEAAMVEGMRLCLEHAGLVTEPAAGIAVGAVLRHPARFAGRRVGLILCGGNVTAAQRAAWGLA